MKEKNSIQRINEMFDYIEKTLSSGDEVLVSDISKILCENKASTEHIFRFLTGYTIRDYLKNRKMSMACLDIYNNSERILDIAVKYGYSSSQAFSRAFYKFFGCLPKDVKKEGTELKMFVPFVVIRELDCDFFKFKICEKEAFNLHSIFIDIPEESMVGIMARDFWKRFDKSKIKGERYGFTEETKNGYRYHIASDVPFEDSKPFVIPKSLWAIFTLDNIYRRVQDNVDRVLDYWKSEFWIKDSSMPNLEHYSKDSTTVDVYSAIKIK